MDLTAGPAPRLTERVRFGEGGRFELHPDRFQLWVDGQPVHLVGRALDLLFALAAQPGTVLSKAELLDRVWPGVIAEENNLRVQVNALRKLLGNEVIATVPGRGYRFAAEVQPRGRASPPADLADMAAAAPPAAAGLARAQPPDAPQLFGRDEDLRQLQGLLQPGALVTVLGPPGVGKTSVARWLYAQAGVDGLARTWVDLAPLTGADPIVGALVHALGLKEDPDHAASDARRALQAQPRLLVLDNAEHLAAACSDLVVALGPLPQVRMLVTSQRPLGLAAERQHHLQPLPVAPAARAGLKRDKLSDAPAAEALLVARIRALSPRAVPTDAQRPLLQAICRQLDGLPLALEMAAARVPMLGLKGVHDALAERFALLNRGHRDAAPRHLSLQAALDWSLRLLAPPEQALLRALSVWPDGFTLDLAVAMRAASGGDNVSRWATIDQLTGLAEHSLVQVGEGDPPRYRLLESMRAFGAVELDRHPGERELALRGMTQALVDLFSGLEAGTRQPQAEAEVVNAQAAMAWAMEHDLEQAAHLSVQALERLSLSHWRSAWNRIVQSMRPAMESEAGQRLPLSRRADWWTGLARACFAGSDYEGARDAARRAAGLQQAAANAPGLLNAALVWISAHQEPSDELDAALRLLQDAHQALRQDASAPATSEGRFHRAMAQAMGLKRDHDAEYRACLAESASARVHGFRVWAQAAQSNALYALIKAGRTGEAIEGAQALMIEMDAQQDPDAPENTNVPYVLDAWVNALLRQGDAGATLPLLGRAVASAERAGALAVQSLLPLIAAKLQRHEACAQLIGHLRAQMAERGWQLLRDERGYVEQADASTRAALGDVRTDALISAGRDLAPDAAVRLLWDEPSTQGSR